MQLLKDLRQTANKYRLYRFFEQQIFLRLWFLFIYVLKNPFKTIWFCIKIYILLVILTLFLVFSFSANANDPDLTHLVPANSETQTGYNCNFKPLWQRQSIYAFVSASKRSEALKLCYPVGSQVITRDQPCGSGTAKFAGYARMFLPLNLLKDSGECIIGGQGGGGIEVNPKAVTDTVYNCELPDYPLHTILVNQNQCAKPLSEPEQNPDNCPLSTSVNNIIPTDLKTVCFQPIAPSDYTCKYESANGYVYVPTEVMQNYRFVDCSSGSDSDLPDWQPDPDENNCIQTGSSSFCPADPNTSCNTTSSVSGQTSLICDSGCGFINNDFYCSESNKSTPPDQNNPCNDPSFASSNPVRCSPDNIDKNGDGIIDNSDLAASLSAMTDQNNDILTGLTQILAANRETNIKIETTNRILDLRLKTINDTIQDNVGSQLEEIKDALTGESQINPTINADIPDSLKNNYNWEERNFYTATLSFFEGITNSPIYTTVNNYFQVSFTGTCPTYSVTLDVFGTITFDQWCGETMQSVWPWVEAVILLVFSLLGVREYFR